jgi:ElaB/YqjD/DUF883 family membrane-anchored ribosome-binding protein
MDAKNRESAADVSNGPTRGAWTEPRIKQNFVAKASDAKEMTANALHKTASRLHSRTDQLSDFGHSAAEGLRATADYMRESDVEDIAFDVQAIVRRYPVQALAAAAFVGFLFARGLRRLT